MTVGITQGGITPTVQRNSTCTLILEQDAFGPLVLFTFPVNPSDIQIDRPSRQNVTQTLTGAYQDHLGEGLLKVSVRGHTGWRQLVPGQGDGFQSYQLLRQLLHEYDRRVAKGNPNVITLRLLMDIPTNWEHFRVAKEGATFARSRTSPLLFRFDLSFIVLSDLNATSDDPSPSFTITTGSTPTAALRAVLSPTVDASAQHASSLVGGQGPKKTGTAGFDPAKAFGYPSNCDVVAYDTTTYSSGAATTISQLADTYYRARGFQCDRGVCPKDMWPLIAAANPIDFPNQNAVYSNTVLPFAGAQTEYLAVPRFYPELGSPYDLAPTATHGIVSDTDFRGTDNAADASHRNTQRLDAGLLGTVQWTDNLLGGTKDFAMAAFNFLGGAEVGALEAVGSLNFGSVNYVLP